VAAVAVATSAGACASLLGIQEYEAADAAVERKPLEERPHFGAADAGSDTTPDSDTTPEDDDACDAGDCVSGCARVSACALELGDRCSFDESCASGYCVNGLCCDTNCTGACSACDRPGRVGTCVAIDTSSDADHCGACGAACSLQHVAAECNAGECVGACAAPYLDCNGDKRRDGCEIDSDADPEHCGDCEARCPYGVCRDGGCPGDVWGFPADGGSSDNRGAATLMGMRVFVGDGGDVAALGIRTLAAGVRLRLGLYGDSGGAPQALVAQTEELTSRVGVTEGTLRHTAIAPGSYWLFLITDGTLHISTEAGTTDWWFTSQGFGPFPASAPPMTSITAGIANAYVVLIPSNTL